MMPQATVSPSPSTASATGGRLVSTEGRVLPLRHASLTAHARGGLARIELRQVFENSYAEPLRVRYQVPLPSDGAVTGYRFSFGDTTVAGRVEPKAQARERFENAILAGQTAALLDQERSSLFSQEVGNIPPKCAVEIVLTVDQPLRWFRELGRHGWEWRFPTVVGPRYLGAPGRVADADRISTTTTLDPLSPTVSLTLEVRDEALARTPHSPSHSLVTTTMADRAALQVQLAQEDAALDRDVVVRWEVEQPRPGVRIDVARPPHAHAAGADAFALLTVLPPASLRADETVARDLIVLLDTSGSMGGEPLEQAKRIVLALVDTLTERDELEMIEFSTEARRWKRRPVSATPRKKAKAADWLQGLRASGGTEMKTGLLAALEGLRPEAQRQVILVSDGYIGFESEIVATVLDKLPTGSRLHTVGVGSAVNRSLTQPVARAGRGLELIVGVGEDPERAAAKLVGATEAPVIVDLQVEGDALIELAPARPRDLYAGSPALLCARMRAAGGSLWVRGRTAAGTWEQQLQVLPTDPDTGSQAIVALWARERVEDLDTLRAGQGFTGSDAGTIDARVEALGVGFQVSTRMTSWIAVSTERTVDPTAPSRTETMPHGLPHGTSAAGLGLRAAAAPAAAKQEERTMLRSIAPAPRMRSRGALGGAFGSGAGPAAPPPPPAPSKARREEPAQSDGFAEGSADKGTADDEEVAAPPRVSAPAGLARPPSPAPAAAPKAEAKKKSPPRWRATAKRVGAQWVVEIETTTAFSWERPATVLVVLSDGRSHDVRLNASKTTGSSSLEPGATLRLVFDVIPGSGTAATPAAPAQLHLTDGTVIDVVVDAGRG